MMLGSGEYDKLISVQTFYNIHFVQTQSAVIPNGVCKIKLERQLHLYASTKCNKLDRDNSKQVRNLVRNLWPMKKCLNKKDTVNSNCSYIFQNILTR